MKIDILTIFPGMFEGFLHESIIKRAIEKGLVQIETHDIRAYSKDPHRRVDDYGFGGGKGMVLMPQPIFDAVEDRKKESSKELLMTPQGKPYKQSIAYDLSKE